MRNTYVGRQRLCVSFGQALRVHRDHRRAGYGNWVRSLPWAVGIERPNATQYDYIRSQNYAVVNWWRRYTPGIMDNVPEREGDVPGIPVGVLQYPSAPLEAPRPGIRNATRADLRACVSLINRTHRGRDLFRPYTVEFLEDRLDEGFWGARPPGWTPVYSWADFHVVEDGDRIVACGGLWDRGRDLRERWRHKETGEEKVVSATALIDFGFAPGHEAALAGLIGRFRGETHRLARDYLLAPVEHLPRVAALLEHHTPEKETRALQWRMKEPALTRPYLDLVYW